MNKVIKFNSYRNDRLFLFGQMFAIDFRKLSFGQGLLFDWSGLCYRFKNLNIDIDMVNTL